MLTKKQKADRESLRVKMCHHQNEASKYRRQIELLDNKDRDTEIKKILGKCFLQRSEKDGSGHNGYVRVEGFRRDYTPVGTEISIYGSGKSLSMNIQLNHGLFRNWIDNDRRTVQQIFESSQVKPSQ